VEEEEKEERGKRDSLEKTGRVEEEEKGDREPLQKKMRN
jgi:hypothetical protein